MAGVSYLHVQRRPVVDKPLPYSDRIHRRRNLATAPSRPEQETARVTALAVRQP